MTIREVLRFPDPILTQRAELVTRDLMASEAFQANVKDAMDTLFAKGGLGLAASQLGIVESWFVMRARVDRKRPMYLLVINPMILERGPDVMGDEGCLSFGGERFVVPAPSWVEVSYVNASDEHRRERVTGLNSRIFCHEVDHLHGKTVKDRARASEFWTTLQVNGAAAN